MPGQLGGSALFPVLPGVEDQDTHLSEVPSSRIQPYLFRIVITYAPSCCLGLLRKLRLSTERAFWVEILP